MGSHTSMKHELHLGLRVYDMGDRVWHKPSPFTSRTGYMTNSSAQQNCHIVSLLHSIGLRWALPWGGTGCAPVAPVAHEAGVGTR